MVDPTKDTPQKREPKSIEVIYRPAPGDPVSTTWRGRTFVKGQPVVLDDSIDADHDLIEAAKGNHFFDVDGESKIEAREAAQRTKETDAAKAEVAVLEERGQEMEQRHEAETHALEAKHQGERDAFLNANEKREAQLRAIIRGSDGSDDLEATDAPQEGKPAVGHDPAPRDPAPPLAPPLNPPLA